MKEYKVLAKFDNLLKADDLEWKAEYLLLEEFQHYIRTLTYNTEIIKEITKPEALQWVQTKVKDTHSKMKWNDYFS